MGSFLVIQVFTIFKRTIIESKSQPMVGYYGSWESIYNIQKNNNWKQITTKYQGGFLNYKVFTIFKRTIIIDSVICFLLASMNPPTAITHSPSDLESKSQQFNFSAI